MLFVIYKEGTQTSDIVCRKCLAEMLSITPLDDGEVVTDREPDEDTAYCTWCGE